MNNDFQTLKENFNPSRTQLFILTSIVDDELNEYLNDDFNFETAIRNLNLKDQLKVKIINNADVRNKLLTNKLFKIVSLNYIIHNIKGGNSKFNPWNELKFNFNKLGKPSLDEQETYHFQFSDSSSNKILVIVFETNSDLPIGVDLSHSKQDSISSTKFIEQFEPIFDKSEIDTLNDIENIKDRYIAFNQLWTLKEAFTKLLGCGLNIDLSKFFFNINKSQVYELSAIENEKKPFISKTKINWTSMIDLNVHQLRVDKNEFLENLKNTEFYCRSGFLCESQDGNLPVIISVINQNSIANSDIICYNLNIGDLLKEQTRNL